jgi:DNA-binding NtrC family response regulator
VAGRGRNSRTHRCEAATAHFRDRLQQPLVATARGQSLVLYCEGIMSADILIVDDEADIRELVSGILQDEGYATRTAPNSDEAQASVVARRPNLIFLDIWLQNSRLDGLQLLDSLTLEYPQLPIVLMLGHGNTETAVSAIKRGAYEFLEKPFNSDRLLLVAERALKNPVSSGAHPAGFIRRTIDNHELRAHLHEIRI